MGMGIDTYGKISATVSVISHEYEVCVYKSVDCIQ